MSTALQVFQNLPIRRLLWRAAVSFLTLLSCLLAPTALAAQDSKGKDFWLMFNVNCWFEAELSLFITGATTTNGVISINGLGFSKPFSVAPGVITTVTIPGTAQVGLSDLITNLGIHVVANDPVTVYGLTNSEYSADAFLGLPTDFLGTEYLTLSYGPSRSQFGIVGTQPGTVVTITPTASSEFRTAGVPYTISLNQGQTYHLQSSIGDLSGTEIASTAPVAVFGSHFCTAIPDGFGGGDHIVEQMPPTTSWGKSFVTMPLATRLGGDTFRILAATNGTDVRLNGVTVATLNRGQVHEHILTAPSIITSSKPVLVAQYAHGSTYDGVIADPFEMLIPAHEQFQSAYTVTTPASGFPVNYINVMVPNGGVGSTKLDGVIIPAANFTAIPGSGFSGAQLSVSLGTHNLTGPLPFGVFVYGFAEYESYGYPGGMSLSEVAVVSSLSLSPTSASAPAGTRACFNARVRDQFNQGMAGIRVDFAVTGVNPRTGFADSNAAGKARYCYTGANVGVDKVVASVGTLFAKAKMIWSAMAACMVDEDNDIDNNDLSLIRAAIGQQPVSNDTRDSNRDGKITNSDALTCVARCTNPGCAH